MALLLAIGIPVVGPLLCGWLFAAPYGSFGVWRP